MTQVMSKMTPEDDGDVLLTGSSTGSPALERYRAEKALLAKMEREEKEGSLIPRDLIRQGFTRVASRLRQAGEILLREYGPSAADVLNRALDDADREVRHEVDG